MNKLQLIQSVLWDYKISPGEIEQLISGEKDEAGHYTFDTFLLKMIRNLPWYTVLDIVPLSRLKQALTTSFIASIRQPSLQKKYEYVRSKLQSVV